METNKAEYNMMKKYDYEIMFKDSPEYFLIKNAKMIQEYSLVRFICFEGDKYKEEVWYPTQNIYRIKRY